MIQWLRESNVNFVSTVLCRSLIFIVKK